MKARSLNIDQSTDLEIISLYKRTLNKELIGVLYKRYMALVYGVCLKYLKERELAKDMTMQVFEKLLENLQNQDVTNFKSWLYVLSKNECLMSLRKQSRVNGFESVNGQAFMESPTHPHHEHETLEDDISQLETCIGKLNDAQKQCIRLFYLEKKCYQEICELTGYEMKKVKSYLQNGRRNLKLCIEKLRGQEEQTY